MGSKGDSRIKGRRGARSERGVDRGPGYNKLTHKGPPVINTRRTRGSDCINWRRKRKKTAARMGPARDLNSKQDPRARVCVSYRKMSLPSRFISLPERISVDLLPRSGQIFFPSLLPLNTFRTIDSSANNRSFS